MRGIRFFFCQVESGGFQEHAGAICPSIRCDVILLRLQYEFWQRYIVFPAPMEWSALPVPERVLAQFSYAGLAGGADDVCSILAREIWYQPGMTTDEALHAVCRELPDKYPATVASREIRHVIDMLAEQYLLSEKGNHLWVTLRNPERQMADWAKSHRHGRARQAIWWTRLF